MPARNLYWGGAGGFQAYFKRARGYRRVMQGSGESDAVLEREVYRFRVRRPSASWRRRGVKRAFDVLLVGLAYRGKRIDRATNALTEQVLQERGGTIRLPSKEKIPVGGYGHVVGYAGHNHLMDVADYRFPARTRRQQLGFFALGCRTGQYLARALSSPESHGLLLTLTLMYPGAFTIDGIVRGIAAAEPQRLVYLRGVRMYAKYQRRPFRNIRFAFVHDRQKRYIKRFLSPRDGD